MEKFREHLPNRPALNTKKVFDTYLNSFFRDLFTAMPVVVVDVHSSGTDSPAGYVDVLPLIKGIDSFGEVIEPVVIYNIPFFRLQSGTAAVVLDPVPGDVGLTVASKYDASALEQGENTPVAPPSYRTFDISDGFYIGGFLNAPPQTFIELRQDGTIKINAERVEVSGDVIANGVSLHDHTHTGVHGETTTGHQL